MKKRLMFRISGNAGFTLLELLVSLVLIGIIATLAGLGIVAVVEGFLFTKMNAATVQKGQVAMKRLVKEFNRIRINGVTSASANSIMFSAYKDGVPETHTVSLSGTDLLLDDIVLTDSLNSGDGFELGYYDAYDSEKYTTWTTARTIIEITIRIKGADGQVSTFTQRVMPRNL